MATNSDTWRFIYTPGPMKVVGTRYSDGTPSEYAKRFGMTFKPGNMITVEYPADSTSYYDPPLSFWHGPTIRKEIHEEFLRCVPRQGAA